MSETTLLASTYRVYAFRWLVLIAVSTFSAVSGFVFQAFPPIAVSCQSIFDVSAFSINSLSGIWSITYLTLAPFSSNIFERMGVRTGIMLGNYLTLGGCIVRLVIILIWPPSLYTFWFGMFGGTFIISLGQIFCLAAPPLISARWFGENERVMATTLLAMANSVGNAIGYFVAALVVRGPNLDEFKLWMGIQTASALFATLLGLAFVRSYPKSPPSASAAKFQENSHASQGKVAHGTIYLSLFKNIQFAALCYTFATVIGLFFTLSSIMTELLQDNYDEAQCGLLGGIINLAAGVGALPVGPLLDRYKWFKSSLVTGAVTFFATFAIFLFGNKPDNMVLLSIASGLVGTTASAVIAIGFEMAIETTFPIPEEYGGTMLMVAANLHSLITLIFFSLQPQVSVSVYLFLALAGSAVVSAILLPRKYRRIAYESRVDVSKGDDDPRASVLGNGTKQSDRQATEESQLLLHVN